METDLNTDQSRYGEIIRSSGEALLSIINDVLDFSKIEAGKLQLEEIDFDLRSTVEDTLEMLSVRAHEKGLELTCLVDPGVPTLLKGDPGRLRQIIVNLAGNAIKFTHQGEVGLRVQCLHEDDQTAELKFLIRDTGIGIPAARVESLFTAFTQIDSSNSRKYGGTGLGLAISKQLIEIMGGTIRVQSTYGSGSTFAFTAVLKRQPERSLPPAGSRRPGRGQGPGGGRPRDQPIHHVHHAQRLGVPDGGGRRCGCGDGASGRCRPGTRPVQHSADRHADARGERRTAWPANPAG